MFDTKALAAPFPQSAVSWRAQTLTKDGNKAMALAYIDARDVMERLDAVCGPDRWQCRYPHADKKTVCEIGIDTGNGWVWKADGAGDSDVEAEKGALSDAFKRAAVRWGIGRYLYDLETPWVPCESRENNGKRFFVKFTDDPWNHVRKRPETKPEPVKVSEAEMDMLAKLDEFSDLRSLTDWIEDNKHTIDSLPNDGGERVRQKGRVRFTAIKQQQKKDAA